jgi:hypothetical protein
MSGKTKTFPVTDAADLPIVASSYAREISVAEDPSVVGWPTTGFLVKKPTPQDQGIRRPEGASYIFHSGGATYAPGDLAGYIRLPAGAAATTFQQDES